MKLETRRELIALHQEAVHLEELLAEGGLCDEERHDAARAVAEVAQRREKYAERLAHVHQRIAELATEEKKP